MAIKISSPSVIKAAGNKPKIIEEYVGRVNTNQSGLSIARMKSPGGWVEPGQRPEFDEYTIVLKGMLTVKTRQETFLIKEQEGILIYAGEWVQYSTPEAEGAEYVSICLPAFSPETVHRDE
ncbi:MAG TPA: cupin [Ignavibacteriales bacterium]|nr:cupin [Ignavibacteriales bacterium]